MFSFQTFKCHGFVSIVFTLSIVVFIFISVKWSLLLPTNILGWIEMAPFYSFIFLFSFSDSLLFGFMFLFFLKSTLMFSNAYFPSHTNLCLSFTLVKTLFFFFTLFYSHWTLLPNSQCCSRLRTAGEENSIFQSVRRQNLMNFSTVFWIFYYLEMLFRYFLFALFWMCLWFLSFLLSNTL